MGEINLLDRYPRATRDLQTRSEVGETDRRVAKQFGQEYFDGTRNQGYGGYRYDGRWRPIANRLKEHYQLGAGSRVLDVGCAKGFLLHDLLLEIPGILVEGVDLSPYAIERAMTDTKPFVRVGNATELPYEDQTFDLVISINTIHNLKPLPLIRSLKEIMRVSRGNSFIVVDAYRTDEERRRLLQWNLTAETHMYVSEWERLFKEVGYTGDYYWFTP